MLPTMMRLYGAEVKHLGRYQPDIHPDFQVDMSSTSQSLPTCSIVTVTWSW